jgi:hypothetical protein
MEEDDGALSEIEPDSVPNEVRDWLAMTFTRSMSTIKRRPSDKPKFKSVAQAIRAGIMVDRFVIYPSIAIYTMRKKNEKIIVHIDTTVVSFFFYYVFQVLQVCLSSRSFTLDAVRIFCRILSMYFISQTLSLAIFLSLLITLFSRILKDWSAHIKLKV